MKLWQKVFLCTLALVMLAVDIASAFILKENINTTLRSTEEAAVRENTLLCVNISNNIAYKQLRDDLIQMSREQMNQVIDQLVRSQSSSGTDLYVFEGETLVSKNGSTDAQSLLPDDYLTQVQQSDECLTVIVSDSTGGSRLFTGSSLTLGSSVYCLYTCKDLSQTFLQFQEQWKFVKMMSLFCSLFIAIILLGIVYFLLAPLGRMNRTLRQMAQQGDYSLRLLEKGSTEIRELSGNINRMAQSR